MEDPKVEKRRKDPLKWGSKEDQLLLQTVLDAIPDVIGIQDPNHRIIRYNEAGYNLLNMTQDEVFGKECYRLIGKEDPCNLCATSETYVTKLPTKLERYEDALGIWLDVRAYPVLDENNELKYVIEHLRDITREKRAEQALKESENKFKNLVEATSDMIWEVDEKWTYTYLSPNVCEILGYQPHEVLGKRPFDFLDDESIERAIPMADVLSKDPRPLQVLENTAIHKDGTKVIIETSGLPILDDEGNFRGFRGIDRDITKRKKAESDLKYRLRFENVLSSISTDFITMPVDNIDDGINNALEKIGELVGADRAYVFLFKEKGLIMDNSHEWCREGIRSAIDQLQNLDPNQFYIIRKMMETRKEFYLHSLSELPEHAYNDRKEFEQEGIQSIITVPILVGDEDLGFIGFDSVRTERTWSEDTIDLLKLVGGIIASAVVRKRSQEDLILERNRAELYLDLLGHDIGNLHQGIFTSIQLARMKKDMPGSLDLAMDRAEEITKRSMMLVKSVVLLSKLRAKEPELIPIKICEPINQAMETVKNLFSHREIEFITNCGAETYWIMAEPVVSELFFNLFHNGVKFQETDTATIEVFVESWENSIAFKISDHGPGIPDSMKGTIFQRFTKSGNGSQTGLGLSIVQALVDRYNGTIDITDRVLGDPSQGACFIVTFPLKKKGQ